MPAHIHNQMVTAGVRCCCYCAPIVGYDATVAQNCCIHCNRCMGINLIHDSATTDTHERAATRRISFQFTNLFIWIQQDALTKTSENWTFWICIVCARIYTKLKLFHVQLHLIGLHCIRVAMPLSIFIRQIKCVVLWINSPESQTILSGVRIAILLHCKLHK